MSHIRYDEKSERHRKSDCKKGRHHYGGTQHIGAGIARRVCETCSAVTIDLTNSYELVYPVISSQPQLSAVGLRSA